VVLNSQQRTQLSLATEHGDATTVVLLLEKGGANIDSPGITGRTPLSFAAGSGHEASC